MPPPLRIICHGRDVLGRVRRDGSYKAVFDCPRFRVNNEFGAVPCYARDNLLLYAFPADGRKVAPVIGGDYAIRCKPEIDVAVFSRFYPVYGFDFAAPILLDITARCYRKRFFRKFVGLVR